MMKPSFSNDSAAVVGRAEDRAWCDTMPGGRMALRVHSVDVGGAFTIVDADVPAFTGPPLDYHEEREEIFEVLDGRFRFLCAGDEFEPGRDGTRGTAQSIHRRAHGRCGRRLSRGGMAHRPDSGGICQGEDPHATSLWLPLRSRKPGSARPPTSWPSGLDPHQPTKPAQ